MIYASFIVKALIIAGVIIVFLGVTYLNIKTKKPEKINTKSCDACDVKSSCPLILSRDDDEKDEQENK